MSMHLNNKVAIDLIKTAAALFFEGTGHELDPNSPDDLPFPGFVDEINPENQDMLYWANSLMHFVRTVHGILQNNVLEDND